MSKRLIALSTMLVSILFILISVGKVTMRGVAVFEATLNQSFLLSSQSYYNLIESGKSIFVLSTLLFIVGCILPFVPNFLLFEQYKRRCVILMIINTVSIVLVFLSYQLYSYMFMMAMVCILYVCNVLIQFIHGPQNKVNIFITISCIFIFVINCYYLYEHFMRQRSWLSWNDLMLKDMINISRINIFCFALWFIPYIILIIKEILYMRRIDIEKT